MRDSSLSRALRTLRVVRARLRLSKFVESIWVLPPTTSQKCKRPRKGAVCILAERVGFEPTVR